MLSIHSNAKKRRIQKRKSCTECIKAKRRCDRGPAECARCAKQRLECRYVPYLFDESDTLGDENCSRSPEQDDGIEWSWLSALDTRSVGGLESSTGDNNQAQLSYGGSSAVDDIFVSDQNLINLNIPPPQTPSMVLQQTSTSTNAVVSSRTSSTGLPSFAASRLDYGVSQLKLAPSLMVHQNGTPWSHAFLYEEHMPRTMHDAIAACALYLTKNDTNSRYIFRHIELRVRELLTSPMPSMPLELLSRAQSLLLYQIIRVFDGDISARAQAEKDLAQLKSLAYSLHSLVFDEDEYVALSPPQYPTGLAKSVWKSWIFRESARRTFLLIFFFLSLHYLFRGDHFCEEHPPLMTIWTASAHLWHAPTVLDFSIAWKDKRHFLINDLDYTELLADATPDTVDDFGKVFLVAHMGIDDARGWFYSRGGSL